MFKCELCVTLHRGGNEFWSFSRAVEIPFAPYPGLEIGWNAEMTHTVKAVEWDFNALLFDVVLEPGDERNPGEYEASGWECYDGSDKMTCNEE